MLCLKQCIDMCDLSAEEVGALGERASLAEIAAAQAACPRKGSVENRDPSDDEVACTLLDQVRAADDFAELRRVARRYRAFALARAAARA
jgi:hypothetical protein